MGWYYFEAVHNGDGVTRDHTGVALPDMEAAQAHALGMWRRLIKERATGGRDARKWNVAILNVHGTVMALVPHPTGPDGEECALG